MNIKAKTNEYQQEFPNFSQTPKAVVAAIAMSLALRLCHDEFDAAQSLLRNEWEDLHTAGIVPQRPPNMD